MANFYLDNYNSFLQDAEQIYTYLSGNYMNSYEGQLLECSQFTDTIDGMKLVELSSYRKNTSGKELFDNFKAVVKTALSSFHRCNCSVGYFIVSDGEKVKLYFGSEVVNSVSFEKILRGVLPDANIVFNGFETNKLKDISAFGGVVTGSAEIAESSVDMLLDEIVKEKAVVSIIARPVERSKAELYSRELSNLYDISSSFDQVVETYGTSSRLTIKNQFQSLNPLREYLKYQNERVSQNQNDLWKVSIWFGSSEMSNAISLGGKIAGTISAASKNISEKGRFFRTTKNPLQQGKIAFSNDEYDNLKYPLTLSLRKGSLYSLATTSELSSLFQVPVRSHMGINVIDFSEGVENVSAFATNPPPTAGNAIIIGREVETNQIYNLSLNDFSEHMLITGGPGGGKTNTVMTILGGLYNKNIPFCIIEPSKKEYWKMVGDIKDLKIYSCGFDAYQLTVNPFEPEEGIIIGNHIDDLMHAFYGAFDMEEPTRLSLDGLIKYTYKKLGWSLDELAYDKGKRYPVIQDLFDNLPEYSDSGIKSGEEVKRNIEGSILRRLEAASTGTIANVTSSGVNITGRELCSGSVLVELDDLSLELKPFITNLLLIKMNQFLRQRDSDNKLKNVIIIEEAHNVFSKISDNNAKKTSKDISSEYFSNMLSEIRALGTGIIVVDQGASKINSAAVAHTKIKIMHAVTDESDVKAEAFALRLDQIGSSLLPSFKTGEALVAVRGHSNVCKVMIDRNKLNSFGNFGCVFCNHRRFCDEEDIVKRIMHDQRGGIMLSNVLRCRFNGNEIKNYVNSYLKSLNVSDNSMYCAFGYMMSHNHMACSDREKRKILFRYLKK